LIFPQRPAPAALRCDSRCHAAIDLDVASVELRGAATAARHRVHRRAYSFPTHATVRLSAARSTNLMQVLTSIRRQCLAVEATVSRRRSKVPNRLTASNILQRFCRIVAWALLISAQARNVNSSIRQFVNSERHVRVPLRQQALGFRRQFGDVIRRVTKRSSRLNVIAVSTVRSPLKRDRLFRLDARRSVRKGGTAVRGSVRSRLRVSEIGRQSLPHAICMSRCRRWVGATRLKGDS